MRQHVAENGTAPRADDLVVFRAVATDGGVNGAARALELPRSTVSRRLSRLEEQLQVRLFHRAGGRLVLTDVGTRLLERVRAVLDDLAALAEDARGVTSVVRGRLRMSAPRDLAGESQLWLDLLAAFPEVAFEVELTNRYVDVVREGFDLAMRGGRGADETLTVRRLGSYALFAVASPSFARKNPKLQAPVDLRSQSCLLLSPFSKRADAPALRPPHRHVVLDDPHVLRLAALAGHGIAILPRSLVDRDLKRGRLVPVLEAYAPLEVPLYAAYAERKLVPATIRAVVNHLQGAFGGATVPS